MRVNTTIDNVSPAITYSSGWSDSKTSDPMWTEYYLSTYIMCSRAGANATFTFNGTGVWLYGALRKDHGLYNITLDGTTTTYDGFGAGDGLYQQPLFAAPNLSPGIHVVTLTNNRNSSTYSNLDLDFIIWEEELGGQNDTLNNQTDDDNASGFEYGPAATAWNTVPENVIQYHGGTGHTTVSSTAYVTYTFTGDAVSIFGALGPTQGPYSVQLDGNAPANYSAVAPSFFAQQLLYHATGLGGGQHSVRLTNMPAKTGDSLSVDYAIANAVQVPIITTSSTSSASTSSSATTTSTSETAAATSDTPPPSSKGLPTGGIVAIVVGALALMAIISFALMMWRRKKQDQKDKDDPDMIVVYPEPYSVGHDSYGGGAGRYIPPSQYMSGGYNPLESGGSNASPIYPPNRNLYNQPGAARGDYFPPGQQQPDGASLFSGYAPGPPRMPAQETGRPRVDSSSTGHGHPLSEVATTVPYGSTAYTANSNGSSRLPEHGHSVLNVSEHPLPPLPANNQSLALHTAPPLPPGRIPPRKGQVTLPPSAAAEQQQEFRGMSEEELRRRRMNVEGREQDFGPLLMDDVLPSQPGVPLPPDYSQATEVLRR